MKKNLRLNVLLEIGENSTANDIDAAVLGLSLEVRDRLERFGHRAKVAGPEFQALLHTPCSQYAG